MAEKPIIHSERNIGDTRLVPPASELGERGPLVEIIRTTGVDEAAQLLTVTVAGWGVYEPVGEGGQVADTLPRGPLFTTIEWGIKGARSEVELDLPAGGVVLSLVASTVKVSARYDGLVRVGGLQLDPVAIGGEDPGPKQRVGAMIGYGAYGAASRLTRTFRLDDVALPGGEDDPPPFSELIQIPNFARRLLVAGPDLSGTSYVVRFYGFEAFLVRHMVQFGIGERPAAIDLPGDCAFVELQNLGPGVLHAPALVFEIGI